MAAESSAYCQLPKTKRRKVGYTPVIDIHGIYKECADVSGPDFGQKYQDISAMNVPSSRDQQFNNLEKPHCLSAYNFLSDKAISFDSGTYKFPNEIHNSSELSNVAGQEDITLPCSFHSEIQNWVRPSDDKRTKLYLQNEQLSESLRVLDESKAGNIDFHMMSTKASPGTICKSSLQKNVEEGRVCLQKQGPEVEIDSDDCENGHGHFDDISRHSMLQNDLFQDQNDKIGDLVPHSQEEELEKLLHLMKLSQHNTSPTFKDQIIGATNSELCQEEQGKLEERFEEELERIMNNPLNKEEENILNVDSSGENGEDTTDPKVYNPQSDATKPLYTGATITVSVSLMLIMSFSIRHKLSGSALSDLLTLVLLHCIKPVATNALSSIFHFKKFFQGLKTPLVSHKYCANCFTYIENNEDRICSNTFCNKDLTMPRSTGYFIEIPVINQLKSFFAKKGFYKDIQYRFERKKKSETAIEDIYDGRTYKQLLDKGLANKHNISLMLNTDGIPVFKSSKFSLWPFYYVINELSPCKRQKRENLIFAGLWFGPDKPHMMTYLRPFCISLRELQDKGIEVESPDVDDKFVCKVFLIAACCDLPAKCLLTNTVQFNGHCGCSKCLQVGISTGTSKGGHVHVYPFDPNNPKGPERTHQGMTDDAKLAMSNNPVNGVKGPCWLTYLRGSFDLVKGNSIDYMHGVCLGIMKQLLTLWFAVTHSSEGFSHASSVTIVDQRLDSIKPPNNITRMPRSITQHFKFWKASELRAFLLFMAQLFSEVYLTLIILNISCFLVKQFTSYCRIHLKKLKSVWHRNYSTTSA